MGYHDDRHMIEYFRMILKMIDTAWRKEFAVVPTSFCMLLYCIKMIKIPTKVFSEIFLYLRIRFSRTIHIAILQVIWVSAQCTGTHDHIWITPGKRSWSKRSKAWLLLKTEKTSAIIWTSLFQQHIFSHPYITMYLKSIFAFFCLVNSSLAISPEFNNGDDVTPSNPSESYLWFGRSRWYRKLFIITYSTTIFHLHKHYHNFSFSLFNCSFHYR